MEPLGKEFDPEHPLQRQIEYLHQKAVAKKTNAFLPITCGSCHGTFAVDHAGTIQRSRMAHDHKVHYWCVYCGHRITIFPANIGDLKGLH